MSDDIASAPVLGDPISPIKRLRCLLDDLRGTAFHVNELANALEVLTNLSYMIRAEVSNPRQILLYLTLFDSQILNLAELVKSGGATAANGAQYGPAPDKTQTFPVEIVLDTAEAWFDRGNAQLRATNFAKDRDSVGSINIRTPLQSSAGATSFLTLRRYLRV